VTDDLRIVIYRRGILPCVFIPSNFDPTLLINFSLLLAARVLLNNSTVPKLAMVVDFFN
jgi:hypothetical protein